MGSWQAFFANFNLLTLTAKWSRLKSLVPVGVWRMAGVVRLVNQSDFVTSELDFKPGQFVRLTKLSERGHVSS
ncbi:hypothetical protein N692_08145 [Lactiplantibacillus plantarum EGD-AQ4]|nr:hypothetical protein N692_08145 [Lactiplantibacillus plantarum EGD-AQ4]